MLTYTVLAVTPAEAQSYIDARGLTGWPPLLADQNKVLRRGQDYIAREYNDRFTVTVTDTAPTDVVKFAIVEAALTEARSPGSLSPVVTAATAKILTQVGDIKWTPVTASASGNAAKMMKPTLTNVEAMLASISKVNRGSGMVVV
jgi:hypothetical protein